MLSYEVRSTYHLRGKECQRLPGKVIHKLVSRYTQAGGKVGPGWRREQEGGRKERGTM